MKKILISFIIFGISNFVLAGDCARPYGLSSGEQMFCEQLAIGEAGAIALNAFMEGKSFTSNKEIVEFCTGKNWFGGYYSKLFLSTCAEKLGYKF